MINQTESNGEIYDDIVLPYSAVKTGSQEQEFEEAFWKVLPDVIGMDILDLACGTGYYTRKFKQRGANRVVGVDISTQMILQAKHIVEENKEMIEYHTEDCATFSTEHLFDIVNAQFLLCYASSKDKLEQMCRNAYRHTKSGGRFIVMNSVLDKTKNRYDLSAPGHWYTNKPDGKELSEWNDGIRVQVTLFSCDKKQQCTFPNYLWTFCTLQEIISKVGFVNVVKRYEHHYIPMVIISAWKP